MRTRADVKRDIIMVKQELEELYKEFSSAERCETCKQDDRLIINEFLNGPGIYSRKNCPYCDFEIVVKF